MLPQGVTDSVSEGYEKMWKTFIQPHKMNYHEHDLGLWVLPW